MNRMFRYFVFAFTTAGMVSLAACSSVPSLEHRSTSSTAASESLRGVGKAHEQEGVAAAATLERRFQDTVQTCVNSDTAPSFLCSGIILRGTDYSDRYHAWNPNPASKKPDGVSFSFLRKDASFGKLAYGYTSGFTVYPILDGLPADKFELEVLCYFPIDAATDERPPSGCGKHNRTVGSDPCQEQSIFTAIAYIRHYDSVAVADRRNHSCGFTMISGTPDSSAIFMQALAVAQALQRRAGVFFDTQNEIVLQSWKQDMGKTLPLETIFYLGNVDESTGLAGARGIQADFYNITGIWRPVIRLTLPAEAGGQASFLYRPADQGIQ